MTSGGIIPCWSNASDHVLWGLCGGSGGRCRAIDVRRAWQPRRCEPPDTTTDCCRAGWIAGGEHRRDNGVDCNRRTCLLLLIRSSNPGVPFHKDTIASHTDGPGGIVIITPRRETLGMPLPLRY